MASGVCPYTELYQDHHQWLEAWLRKRLGNVADAADLAQDTYVRIMTAARLPGPGQSRAFLVQVARGLVIDLHRRRALESAYREALAARPEDQAPSAERQALVLEALIEIDRVLDDLPARVRETFLLSRFHGLTYAAIAERLGISVATVRKYMLKAATACLVSMEASGGLAAPE